jgi:hypothetical protein
MTIRKVNSAAPITEADAGKFIWRDGFCSRPARVTKVAKSRVYYNDTARVRNNRECVGFTVEEGESFCKMDSIKFLCDTIEEAAKLEKMSENQVREINESRKVIIEKYNRLVDSLLT